MFRHVTTPPMVHCQEKTRTRPVHVTNTGRNVLHRREVQGRWEQRSFLQVNNVTMGGGGAHLHYSKIIIIIRRIVLCGGYTFNNAYAIIIKKKIKAVIVLVLSTLTKAVCEQRVH